MILKLAFLTCAFYLGVAVLMEASLLLWARFAGSVSVSASRSAWAVLFGAIWLGSFSIAWRIVWTSLHARLSH